MKKLLTILIFYCILVVLLLPLAVTFLCGGFGKALPQEAKVVYGTADIVPPSSEKGIKFSFHGNNSIGGAIEYEEKRK